MTYDETREKVSVFERLREVWSATTPWMSNFVKQNASEVATFKEEDLLLDEGFIRLRNRKGSRSTVNPIRRRNHQRTSTPPSPKATTQNGIHLPARRPHQMRTHPSHLISQRLIPHQPAVHRGAGHEVHRVVDGDRRHHPVQMDQGRFRFPDVIVDVPCRTCSSSATSSINSRYVRSSSRRLTQSRQPDRPGRRPGRSRGQHQVRYRRYG